jgi:phenylacetate-CoA ligase
VRACALPHLAGTLGLWRVSERRLASIRRRKLQRLLRHAYENVAFYRSLWERARVRPEEVDGPEDLVRLPVVSKEDLLSCRLEERLAQGIDPSACWSSSSSGTTGHPLTVYTLPADRTRMNLGWFRAYLANGLRVSETMAAFVGRRQVRTSQRWYERLGLFRRVEIPAWWSVEEWTAQLELLRPAAITGYVMTLRLLAEHLRDHPHHRVHPRLVFHTSALLDEASRRLFEEQLKCRVVDLYGSEEAGCIAWECPRCPGYHVNADLVVVEILRNGVPARTGEAGEVVVTNLHSYAMPIIRYRQNDVASLAATPPRCGWQFPLLERIEGRVEDFLVLRDGRRLPPHPFYHCIDPVPGVQRWRIVQDRPGEMTLEIVAEEEQSDAVRRAVLAGLAQLTGGAMDIALHLVPEIPIDPRTKFRTIRSAVGALAPAEEWGATAKGGK